MIRCYAQYKDSGVEWIGEIPEGWELKRIKYLALGKESLFLDGDWIESKDIVFDDSQIRYITTGNIGEGKYKEQGLTYISNETFEKLNCTEIFPGDLLISRLNPPIGRCCIVPDLGNRIVTSVDNVVLRPDSQCLKPFLKHAMTNPRYYEYTSLIARGATMQRISRGLLGDVVLPITVDAAEQMAIASFLDRKTAEIDQLIANKEKLIALYEEEKTSIINRAVTKGLDPQVKTKPSGVGWLGDIPEHWEAKRLKYVIESIAGGGTPATGNSLFWNGTIPWVSPKDMKIDEISETEDYVTDLAIANSSTALIGSNSVLIVVRSGILKHTFPVAINKVSVCLNQDMKAIRPSDFIDVKFFFWKLKGLSKDILTVCNKMGATVDSIEIPDLLNLLFSFPKTEEQTAIVTHIEAECSRLDTIIDKFKKQIELFKEYRTTMISEVVTGKIDVRDEVAA